MVRCLRVVIVVVSALWLAVPASAQTARATGTVRDIDGKPIKGATIRAANPDLQPRVGITTSDSKGRWAMIGLRIGVFTFVVDAPGFVAIQAEAG